MKEIHAALKKFQEQCPSLSKSRRAGLGKFSYQYTPLEEMLSVVQPVLLNSFIQFPTLLYNIIEGVRPSF